MAPQASQTHDSRIRSNIIDLCKGMEWKVTTLSARCCVTLSSIANNICMEFKVAKEKLRNERKCSCCLFGRFQLF